MRLCDCAVVYAETAKTLTGRKGCPRCGGRGVVATPLTADDLALLARNGWYRTGEDSFGHKDRGNNVRPETAIDLAMGDERMRRVKKEKDSP